MSTVIAEWDYDAQEQHELSFKQGDIIQLLEKHNDDWWEGELNGKVGVFPANRVKLEPTVKGGIDSSSKTSSSRNTQSISEENPYLVHGDTGNESVPFDTLQEADKRHNLPSGWRHARDEDGTLYYYNEKLGESVWEMPDIPNVNQGEMNPSTLNELAKEADQNNVLATTEQWDVSKLDLHNLRPEWIRKRGHIQMKMVAEKEGSKLSSWKDYYAVLSKGHMLLYKDSNIKYKKPGRSHPVGCFDLKNCVIQKAGKDDTKRKHCFLVNLPQKVSIYVQVTDDKELATWLDAIMRDIVCRDDIPQDDSGIHNLLNSLTLSADNMKVNSKLHPRDVETRDENIDVKYKIRGNWFHKSGHTRREKVPNVALPSERDMLQSTDVFGGYLCLDADGNIPLIVRACIETVEARGLQSVGIYRLSGSAVAIQKYRTLINQGNFVSFDNEHDINIVAGLLKLYFRELRNPLLTYEYYDWFIEAAKMEDYDERMFQIKSIIHALPEANFMVLEYLMRHLNMVSSYSETNKMEPTNLALIFSIGLLRTEHEEITSIAHADSRSKVMQCIIEQVEWFFDNDDLEDFEGPTDLENWKTE